ncbi:ABC transporter substrate-binding protein [Brevibacillus sp. BC25]|uniref:ABC transporter substrate-binding protein n=1 Tax=Brevibacillus sp. BC25 TaxID=1144308 RepID=UPI0002712FEA|nr:ABC transporter substrate-binding protein [Brevibacillus sp. BC25]EJL32283.1 ABC-type Fe3+-hydroxamate transport system, periplasmic component [Brevibacillus sp. BC25]
MKKKLSGILSVILAAAVVAGCGAGQSTTDTNANNKTQTVEAGASQPDTKGTGEPVYPRTIKHAMGEVTLEKKPERVASVDIMGTDYFLVLDFAPIVSEGFESTKSKSPIFAKYAGGKTVKDLGGKTNLETLLEMDPEVIVMTSTGKGSRFEEFNKMADSIVIDFSVDAPTRLMKIAEVIGKEDKAKQVLADFDKLKNEAKAIADKHKGETVLFLVSNGKDFTVMHPKNFPIYYEEVGLTPIAGLPEDGKIGGRIGIEALSELAPDHIFIAENRRSAKAEEPEGLIHIWKDHPVWKNLKAVKNNHVYTMDTLAGDTFFLGEIAGLEAIKNNLGK